MIRFQRLLSVMMAAVALTLLALSLILVPQSRALADDGGAEGFPRCDGDTACSNTCTTNVPPCPTTAGICKKGGFLPCGICACEKGKDGKCHCVASP